MALLRGLSRRVRNNVTQTNTASRTRSEEQRLDAPRVENPEELNPDFITSDYLRTILDKEDNKTEKLRGHDNGYMHVSSMLHSSFCERMMCLASDTDMPVYHDSVKGGDRVMWKLGRAAEQHVRDQYITAVDKKGILGQWHCKCGHQKNTGRYNDKIKACGFCKTKNRFYRELVLFDHDAGIVGSPDFPIIIGGKLYVVEIKSIRKEDFNDLKSPKVEHILQAGAYRRMFIKDGNEEVADDVIILYVTKDYVYGSPYKEFHVNLSDANSDAQNANNVLDLIWEKASNIRQYRQNKGNLPQRQICNSLDSPHAKKCPYAGECFSRS